MKILKNQTASPVFIADVGQTVPASGQLTIVPSDYDKLAESSDAISLLANGTLIANDGNEDLPLNQGVWLILGSSPLVDFSNELKDNSGRLKVVMDVNNISDYRVKSTSDDSTPNFLDSKIIGNSGKIDITIQDNLGDKSIFLSSGTDIFDKTQDNSDNLQEGSTNLFLTAERVQDIVAGVLDNTSTVAISYDDLNNSITADLIQSGVDHGSISGLLDDDHTQYYNQSRGDARYERLTNKGQANGYASLDGYGKVPAAQLPSYVDDVLEYANLASFPVTGEASIIYVALNTNKTYRWSGSSYTEISPSDVNSVFGRSGIVISQSGDYNASQILNTPSGNISSTDVQTALNELDSEKQPLDSTLTSLANFNSNGILTQTAPDTFVSRSIQAGTGITVNDGSGVSGNPTVLLADVGPGPTSVGNASNIPTITINSKGQVTALSTVAVNIPSTQVLNFTESVQDSVGQSLSNSSTVSLVYDDPANTITANLNNTTVTPGTYGTATQVASFTVDAQGRLTQASNVSLGGLALPSGWMQYYNAANQSTTAQNNTFTKLNINTNLSSFANSLFSKPNATDIQTLFNGYVRVSFKVEAQASANDRPFRAVIVKNGVEIPQTSTRQRTSTNANRYGSVSGDCILGCAVGDTFSLGFGNAESNVTITIFAGQGLFTVQAIYEI